MIGDIWQAKLMGLGLRKMPAMVILKKSSSDSAETVATFLRGLSRTLKTISMTIYHMPAARWFMKA